MLFIHVATCHVAPSSYVLIYMCTPGELDVVGKSPIVSDKLTLYLSIRYDSMQDVHCCIEEIHNSRRPVLLLDEDI